MNSQRTDPPQVSIVILNWNGSFFLPRCLTDLQAQTFQDFEIIVVDNGSTDGSTDNLEERYNNLTLIELGENKGFSVANNIGAKNARGEWIILLNNDAYPEPDWLEQMMLAAETHPDYSFFGCKLVMEWNPEILDGIGDVYHVSGVAWRDGFRRLESEYDLKEREIFSPTAAAALYKKDLYLELGGLDETFFMYHEDLDLGFRMRLRGHKCLFVPDAVIHHVSSGTTKIRSDFQVYHGHRNLVWSYFQNMPGILFWKYLPAHIMMNIVFIVYYILRGQGRTILRSKWDALKGIPEYLRRRKKIQANRVVEAAEIDRMLEHGWLKPYLLGFKARRSQQSLQTDLQIDDN